MLYPIPFSPHCDIHFIIENKEEHSAAGILHKPSFDRMLSGFTGFHPTWHPQKTDKRILKSKNVLVKHYSQRENKSDRGKSHTSTIFCNLTYLANQPVW